LRDEIRQLREDAERWRNHQEFVSQYIPYSTGDDSEFLL
jgi:hypothetical protein